MRRRLEQCNTATDVLSVVDRIDDKSDASDRCISKMFNIAIQQCNRVSLASLDKNAMIPQSLKITHHLDAILSKMKNYHIDQDVTTLNNVLSGVSRHPGMFDYCLNTFYRLCHVEKTAEPDVQTFNRLLRALRKDLHLDASWTLKEENRERLHRIEKLLESIESHAEIKPNLMTFIELTRIYYKIGIESKCEEAVHKASDILLHSKSGKDHNFDSYKHMLAAMDEIGAKTSDIDRLFEIIKNHTIPNVHTMTQLLRIMIDRKDYYRIQCYFDILINVVEVEGNISNIDDIVRWCMDCLLNYNICDSSTQNLRDTVVQFVNCFYFVDHCVLNRTFNIDFKTLQNGKYVARYLDYIKQIYCSRILNQLPLASPDAKAAKTGDAAQNEELQDLEKLGKELLEVAKDVPRQLSLMKLGASQTNLIRDFYSDILMSYLNYENEVILDSDLSEMNEMKEMDDTDEINEMKEMRKFETLDDDDDAEQELGEDLEDAEEEGADSRELVCDLYRHWFEKYYVTRDMWDELNVLNLTSWKYNEIRVIITHFLLQDKGESLMESGCDYLYVKTSESESNDHTQDLFEIIEYLTSAYADCGTELKVTIIGNALKIDLESWEACNEALASQVVGDIESILAPKPFEKTAKGGKKRKPRGSVLIE